MEKISFILNGLSVELAVDPKARLVDVLREELDFTGTKEGCGQGECGACTVLLDGQAVNSCLVLVGQIKGRNVVTIEGLAKDGKLDPLQEAFIAEGAVQCGYCTPGMVLSAKALLMQNPLPSEQEIKEAIAGNLCRCTGYVKIVQAIKTAAASL
ncbi:MAG: (2Fe-2S)-binding protein [Syntrophomonadaceae bacterium]|jgi:carbon-monoxide dehydrogenase small subunit|nr:(2Fe-2S)-binding protein [Syntrophomonadaceae bacterium]